MKCIPYLETISRKVRTLKMILRSIEQDFELKREINPFPNLLVDKLDEQRRLVILGKFQVESGGVNREKLAFSRQLVSYVPPLLECMTVVEP